MNALSDAAAAPAAPDLVVVKGRQQATWASGDYHMIGTQIQIVSELLIEALDVHSTEHVLDVATGSGNAALAAARRGCEVVGIDYVPALLQRGRVRAAAEQLDVDFVEGDAENLPFPDASFDAVLSIYGVMFAPNHRRTAAELVRVCRPGGRIALASWTPGGFIGETFRVFARYVPAVPGLQPPVFWGEENYLESLFERAAESMTHHRRTAVFRFRSAEENVDFFRTYYGPTLRAFESLEPAKRASLRNDLL